MILFKERYGGPSCLCGVGYCSPYGLIAESKTMDLEKDIFPLFNLNDTVDKNKENMIK